ncbi:MAG: hypothetical protein R2741_08745 [Methanolobus sp.]
MEVSLEFFEEMDHEYRRQLLHAAFGLLILLFPFIASEIMLFLSFIVIMWLTYLPEDALVCKYLYKKPLPGSEKNSVTA